MIRPTSSSPQSPAATDPDSKPAKDGGVKISIVDENSFTQAPRNATLPRDEFTLDAAGKPMGLVGPHVAVSEEDEILRPNYRTWNYDPVAKNPFTDARPDAEGNFIFDQEPAFPAHVVDEVKAGKQKEVWHDSDRHLAQTTAFHAAVEDYLAASDWAQRDIAWGDKHGVLQIHPHVFENFYNAFYTPDERQIYAGMDVFKRLGDKQKTLIETTLEHETIGHEAGHALHDALKPNMKQDDADIGADQWGESFADQMAMYSALRDPVRRQSIIKANAGEIGGDNFFNNEFEQEWYADGQDPGFRNAWNSTKVGNTSAEVHDRSQVLSGAVAKIGDAIYRSMRDSGMPPTVALAKMGDIMGTFLIRSTEHTPEDIITLEDVGKAYLTVDAEYFGGKYASLINQELMRRGIFTRGNAAKDVTSSKAAWERAREAVPKLTDSPTFLADNAAVLGTPAGYSLQLQSSVKNKLGETIVRTTLLHGKEKVSNHGLLVFRKDGTLMDAFPAFPADLEPAESEKLLADAKAGGLLSEKGSEPAFVKGADGKYGVEVSTPEGQGPSSHVRIRTLADPKGKAFSFARGVRPARARVPFKAS